MPPPTLNSEEPIYAAQRMFLCFVVLFFSFTRLRNDPQIPTVTCGDVFRIFLRNFTSPEADTLPCACCRAAAVPPCGASVSML